MSFQVSVEKEQAIIFSHHGEISQKDQDAILHFVDQLNGRETEHATPVVYAWKCGCGRVNNNDVALCPNCNQHRCKGQYECSL